MNKIFSIAILIFFCSANTSAQTLPAWFSTYFKQQKLDAKYDLKAYAKPSYLMGDFNGDGVKDVAALVIEKKTRKNGVLIMHQKEGGGYFALGAGTKYGKKGFDEADNLEWVKGWKVNKSRLVYETVFNAGGDIVGGKKIKLKSDALSLWDLIDGEPYSGGTIYWTGKKYDWIHEGE